MSVLREQVQMRKPERRADGQPSYQRNRQEPRKTEKPPKFGNTNPPNGTRKETEGKNKEIRCIRSFVPIFHWQEVKVQVEALCPNSAHVTNCFEVKK